MKQKLLEGIVSGWKTLYSMEYRKGHNKKSPQISDFQKGILKQIITCQQEEWLQFSLSYSQSGERSFSPCTRWQPLHRVQLQWRWLCLSRTIADMQQVIFQDFRPFSVLTYQEGTLDKIIPRMKDYPVSDRVLAYLCRDFACREPVADPQKLNEILRN